MFGLQKYINKMLEVKWFFPAQIKDELEQIVRAEFSKKDNHYVLTNILYSFVDILLALEDLDFDMIKKDNDIEIRILKI